MHLFKPAILLMSSISYINKFIIISLVFIIPFSWLCIDKIEQIKADIDTIELELRGLEQAKFSINYYKSALEFAGIKTVRHARQEKDVEESLTEHENSLRQSLDNLKESNNQSQLYKNADALNEELSNTIEHSRTMSLDRLFFENTRYPDSLTTSIKLIFSQSHLIQDDDISIYIGTDHIINQILSAYKTIYKAKTFDSYLTAYGYLETTSRPAVINLMNILSLQATDTEHNNPHESDEYLDKYNQAEVLRGVAATYQQQVIKKYPEGDFSFDEKATKHWKKNYDSYNKYITHLDNNLNNIFMELKLRLKAKLEERQTQLTITFYAIVLLVAVIFYLLFGFYLSVRSTITTILRGAELIAQGDLRHEVKVESKDELGQLATHFDGMRKEISRLITEVLITSTNAARQAEQVKKTANKSRTTTELQQAETEAVATSVSQLVASVQNVALNTQEASATSNIVNQQSQQGRDRIKGTLDEVRRLAGDIDLSMSSINRVAEESKSISNILDVIRSVSDRTNLLALNAAIEAARAGEHGRGFAVVADEVRSLAKTAQESTEEIERSIERLHQEISNAVASMRVSHANATQTLEESIQVERAFREITTSMTSIVDINSKIATTAEQQTTVVEALERNVLVISSASEDATQCAQVTELSSQELAQGTYKLENIVANFKV